MNSSVYPEQLNAIGIECICPADVDRDAMGRIIMQELVNGIISVESAEYFHSVTEGFRGDKCDAVVLGCTEIPLIVREDSSPLPTLDSTRLLAAREPFA